MPQPLRQQRWMATRSTKHARVTDASSGSKNKILAKEDASPRLVKHLDKSQAPEDATRL